MIQSKSKINVNDVVTVKLVTGEEIIGYYVDSDITSDITLRKPISLVATGQGVGMAPFLMTSDYLTSGTELTFNGDTVVVVTKTNKEFSDAYTNQVSGLDLGNKSPGLII